MSQLTNEQIVNIAQSSVDTVATNIDSVKNNSANIAAILAVWTAMSAIKMAPDAAQAAGLSQVACEAIQARCEQILENVQAVTDVVPATPTKLGVCRGDQTTISTMNGILSLMPHHVSHEPGGADVITSLGSVAEKLQALGTISGDVTIDLSAGLSVSATVGGAVTLAFSNAPVGGAVVVVLRLTNGGSAVVTWPTTISWANSKAPTLTAAGTDMVVLVTDDGGATWMGSASLKYGAGV
mgnify:CR=1 FL=1